MLWGYAGVPHGDLRWWDGDQTLNKLRWCGRNGFRATGLDLKEMADPARRDAVLGIVAEHGLRLDTHWQLDWWSTPIAEIHRRGEAFVRDLEAARTLHAFTYVGTGIGNLHRFSREKPLAAQIAHLAACLGPVARRLADLGCPLALHNGFDWWGRDLAALCQATPGLGLLYDTGNVCVVGQDPVTAAREVAGHVVATHIKDHVLYPWNDPRAKERKVEGQALVVDGAVLGEGDACVSEVLAILHSGARDPEAVVWEWELEPPQGLNGQEAVDRSWAVCRAFEQSLAKPQSAKRGKGKA